MTAPALSLGDIKELCAIALPANIAPIEHQWDIPGPKCIIPVDGWEDAVAEANGRDCGVMRGVDGNLYLVIPVEITHVSVVRPGDVLRVDEAQP
jgi:hypothetical protein